MMVTMKGTLAAAIGAIVLFGSAGALTAISYYGTDNRDLKYALPDSGSPGEDCEDPLIVPELPFRDVGYTCEFADDYDETCDGYPAPGSPDVVYRYAPDYTLAVDISLCRDSAYDTKLYVYEDVCGEYQSGTHIACNEDACSTPSSPYGDVSELLGVEMIAGHTYYIVVDGYGEDCGDYTIDITAAIPGPQCPPETLFGQPAHRPNWNWDVGISEVNVEGNNLLCYESFSGVGEPVCELEWWGLMVYDTGQAFIDCVDSDPTFEITFYHDRQGEPGESVCSYLVVPEIEPTGLMYNSLTLQQLSAELPNPCCSLSAGWVSIQGRGDPDCWFLWMSASENVGDGFSWFSVNGELEPEDFDLSLCLLGEDAPLGACCFPDGSCLVLTSPECTLAGGTWLGAGTTCSPNPCRPPQPDCNRNGVPDHIDIATGTSKDCDSNGVPDECQTDSDGDGLIDPCDGCPNDPGKTEPGVCGCGTPDTDTDGDGVPNCIDNCPTEPNADQLDSDKDGIGDACDDTPEGRPDEGQSAPPARPPEEARSGSAFLRALIAMIVGGDAGDDAEHFRNTFDEGLAALDKIPAGDEEESQSARLEPGVVLGLCPVASALLLGATVVGLGRSRRHAVRR